jgi:hypothetical protein
VNQRLGTYGGLGQVQHRTRAPDHISIGELKLDHDSVVRSIPLPVLPEYHIVPSGTVPCATIFRSSAELGLHYLDFPPPGPLLSCPGGCEQE